MKKIGENIKYIREQFNKSVYDIEKETGLAHELQYKWEKGITEPSIIKCIKLAEFYGISLDELVGRENYIKHTTKYNVNTLNNYGKIENK